MVFDEDVLLIAGPTASGKTALSIDAAQHNDAVIINTDSMQVYADLRVISARPSAEETAQAPHFMFGHVDGGTAYSVAQWLYDLSACLEQCDLRNRKLIFVGGTGLYFNALLQGLSPVPQIDEKVREKWRIAGQFISGPELHKELQRLDPEMARQLRESDRQRVTRALEVYESTGTSLLEWQKKKGEPYFPRHVSFRKVLVMPERARLHERINLRFDLMIENGAMEEVKSLIARDLDPTLPVMKAIGVPHLASYLKGECNLPEAVEKAKAASRQYAKRQSTWFRNSFDDGWETISSV